MTGIPDDLVEKAHDAWHGNQIGKTHRERTIAMLEAVGLSALLERVEAAEGALAELRRQRP